MTDTAQTPDNSATLVEQEGQETQPTGAQAPQVTPAGAETPAEQTLKRMFKVKVDDQEVEVDEEELLKGYQSSRASQKRFQEAAAQRKQVEELLKLGKSDPARVLKELGVDLRQFTESQLQEFVADGLLTPEQRELKETKAKLAALEARDAELKQQQEAEQLQQETARLQQELEASFIKALEVGKLPHTADTVRRMAQKQLAALNKGLELTPEDLAGLVKLDLEEEHKTLLSKLKDEDLEGYLGQELIKKLQKLSLKGTTPVLEQPVAQPDPEPAPVKRNRDKLLPAERKRRSGWGVMDHFGDE